MLWLHFHVLLNLSVAISIHVLWSKPWTQPLFWLISLLQKEAPLFNHIQGLDNSKLIFGGDYRDTAALWEQRAPLTRKEHKWTESLACGQAVQDYKICDQICVVVIVLQWSRINI